MKRNYTAEVCESLFARQNERDADVVRAGERLRQINGDLASPTVAGAPSCDRRHFMDWRAVVGYQGLYEVSRTGEIFDLRRGQLRALVPHTDGYLTVRLTCAGEQKRHYVHRLVCVAFNGGCYPGQQVAHLDGNPRNNRADNLVWATPSENNNHKVMHGTRQVGERNGRAKFADNEIETVRALSRGGHSQRMIAERTGVSKSQVQRILSGQQRDASQAKPLIDYRKGEPA